MLSFKNSAESATLLVAGTETASMNYYVVLGVARDASYEAIRQAFRALARQYHPDAGTGSSVERFRQVVDAYETLGDPARRRAYDRSLAGSRLQPMSAQRVSVRFAPEPLIPESPRRTVTLGGRDVMRDDLIGQLFAEDLFEMLDRLLFRPRRSFPY
jgi:curved DNA-binding protein CbpA